MTDSVFDRTHAELGEPIHTRDYRVEVFRVPPSTMRLVGEIADIKPNGLTEDDPDPLDIHRMTLIVDVELPDLTITACRAEMATHPHAECPTIEATYEQMVGLSIARGFTHEVRERLGGPRGCSHITMLLQAMAPVAWQGMFAFPENLEFPEEGTPEHELWMQTALRMNHNTCHMFADDGPMQRNVAAGRARLPIWARERRAALDTR